MKRFLQIILLLYTLGCASESMAQVEWRHYTPCDGLPTNEVRQVVELPGGQIMVNCEGVFCLFDGRVFHAIECNRSQIHALKNYVGYAHLWQGDSLLWLRDFYHLYLFDARTRTFRYDIEKRLTDSKVSALVRGEGTDEQVDEHWQPLTDSLGVSALVAHAITDRQGGRWIGTRGEGLIYIRPQRPKAHFVGRNDSLLCAARYMMDSHARAWQCTQNGLICRPQSYILCPADEAQLYDKENVAGLDNNWITCITELPDGRMLLCSNGNTLGYFDPGSRSFDALSQKLPQIGHKYRWIVGACPLTNDVVLVYSQNGTFLLDVKNDAISDFTPSHDIARWTEKYNCVLLDSKNRLWLGTQNGLFLIPNSQSAIHNRVEVTRVDGLANNCIRSLVEDKEGNVWVGTSNGISKVTRELSTLNLSPYDGVPQISMEERAAVCLDDGSLVFALRTMSLVTFRPEWFSADSVSYPVQLVGVEINGQQHLSSWGERGQKFHYTQNYFTFNVSALNYANPEHTHYRYRLGGLENSWHGDISGMGLATATYSALPPGDYVFEAQCAVSDGEWGQLLQIPFTISPPWWLTWWMKMIYLLMGLMGLTGLIGIYFKKKRARLEAEAESRVNHLFELREQARHQFVENVRIDASKIGVNSEEESLVAQLLKALEQNLGNSEYSVDQLARDVALGRTNLYKRMQTMLGITPNDFIRSVRLKRAAILLSDTELPIVEISERVGFNTPQYFSTQFKKMFGVTPSEYRKPSKQETVYSS